MKRILATGFAIWLLGAGLGASATPSNLDLSRYRGQVVYLDFWASWCKPCRKSFPWMNSMQREYGQQGLTIIAVNLDEDHADAVRFLDQMPSDFKIVFDPDGKLAEQYKLIGMPSSFLIDRSGHIVDRHMGFHEDSGAEYEREIRELLQKPQSTGSTQ